MTDLAYQFTPVPTLASAFTIDTAIKFLFILGPIGSTKTTTCLYKLLSLAAAQEPSPDGIRRTRIAIVRNTLVSLKQTVLKDALSLFGEIAEYRMQDGMIRFRVADIESEWLFLALETPQDQRRLLSLQLSCVYANEAREIDFSLLMAAFSRCGRYPSPMHGGVKCTQPLLMADSNMGVEGSDLYTFLEETRPPELHYIHQPGAMSPQADWLHVLRPGYYQDMMIGARRSWIETHVHSKWSTDAGGEPVFAEIFDERLHVSPHVLPVLYSPLIVGFDPGVNPAAVVTQPVGAAENPIGRSWQSPGALAAFAANEPGVPYFAPGRTLVHAEIHAANTLLGIFIDELLTPVLQSHRFAGRKVLIIADPTAINRAITGATARGMLQERGYEVELASTNDVEPRLHVIEQALTKTVGFSQSWSTSRATDGGSGAASAVNQGAPRLPQMALTINRECTVLLDGLAGRYRFKRRKVTQELEEEPEKKHPTSDVMDSLGYALLGSQSPRVSARLGRGALPKIQVPASRRAWT